MTTPRPPGTWRKYKILLHWSNDSGAFVAEAPELPGCMAHGRTPEAALKEINEATRLWIETAAACGDPVPKPKRERPTLA